MGWVLIGIFIMGAIVFLVGVPFLDNVVGTRNTVLFTVNADDRGAEMTSFLAAQRDGLYSETIGLYSVEGFSGGEEIELTLETLGWNMEVRNGANEVVKQIGDVKDPEYTEIPLPGLRRGQLGLDT